jgi:hypothetical protein
MSIPALEEIQADALALAVARAVKVANGKAAELGVPLADSQVTITEHGVTPLRCWHVHYGPRDCRRRRGGDLTIVVEEQSGTVQQVVRGQ